MASEEEEEESEVHGRLTDDENFAELPAIEVMNRVGSQEAAERSKLQSQHSDKKSLKSNKVLQN